MNLTTLYYEAALSEKLGVTRDELVKFRRRSLQKKLGDWKMLGRDVVYSELGLKKLADYWTKEVNAAIDPAALLACAVPRSNQPTTPPDKKTAEGWSFNDELQVKRIYPNEHLILATNSDGNELRVWVPANENFRPGMKLKARPQAAGRPWRLIGRCPRYPGRW